jgi:hypothetical protein
MGVDLSPAMRGDRPPPHLVGYSHSSLLADGMVEETHRSLVRQFPRRDPLTMWVAMRDGDLVYKLSDDDGAGIAPHVYDWTADPVEAHDLYDPANPEHAAAFARLQEYRVQLIDGYRYAEAAANGTLPTERQREILRSLGYIQ